MLVRVKFIIKVEFNGRFFGKRGGIQYFNFNTEQLRWRK